MFEKMYAKKEDIPEGFAHLYIERDGAFHLRMGNEIKTPEDVHTLQEANRKEREDHDSTKAKLQAWGDLNPEETRASLDSIPALQAKADSKDGDPDKIEAQVKTRVDAAVAPLNRKIETLEGNNKTLQDSVTTFETNEVDRTITDAIRDAGIEMKLPAGGLNDALMRKHMFEVVKNADGSTNVVTKADAGVTPGLDAKGWLTDAKGDPLTSHWWPASNGGGTTGNDGNTGNTGKNPFSHDNWNSTEQGNVFKADPVRAQKLAESAGTTVGGAKPLAPTN